MIAALIDLLLSLLVAPLAWLLGDGVDPRGA